jgi:hypothetical protein
MPSQEFRPIKSSLMNEYLYGQNGQQNGMVQVFMVHACTVGVCACSTHKAWAWA